jgi:hypothetical protein
MKYTLLLWHMAKSNKDKKDQKDPKVLMLFGKVLTPTRSILMKPVPIFLDLRTSPLLLLQLFSNAVPYHAGHQAEVFPRLLSSYDSHLCPLCCTLCVC